MQSAVSDRVGCGPSTPGLKTDVANFMERANKVIAHPLGAAESSFRLAMRLDHRTGEFYSVGFEEPPRPEAEWQTLALAVRPIIFTDTDATSFNVLTNRIEREHVRLRGQLKKARQELKAWKKYVYIAAEPIGTPASDPPRPMYPPNRMLKLGPNRQWVSSVDITEMGTDYDYANAYLNGMVWHGDSDKAAAYQSARDEMQVHYVKCAELRVISATLYVRNLRQWVLDARAAGHDF